MGQAVPAPQPTGEGDYPATCPACKARTLVEHCPSRTCTWHRCRDEACALIADLKRGTGSRWSTVFGTRVRWARFDDGGDR